MRNQALLEQKQIELREAQEELLYRMENEKYRFYEPTGKGEEYIDMFKSGEYFMIMFSAANGIGKTATTTNMFAHLFFHTGENEYFKGGVFEKWNFPKKALFASTPTNVEKNLIPGLKEWFPKGRYSTKKWNKSYESKWETDSEWSIDIMTYEQDVTEYEGGTYGLIWFDEPPPQAIFKAAISRLRKGGIIVVSATPLAGSAYLYDIFAKGEIEVEVSASENGMRQIYKRRVGYIEADMESACKQHGVRGHLDHDVIMSMAAEFSEDEKQARFYGKFAHLIGMVFKQWNRNIHVIKPFDVTMFDFTVWHALDTHPRNPDAGLWVAVDRKGTKYVVDELYVKATSTELSQKIKNKNSQYRVVRQILEPAAFIVNQHDEDGKSLATRLNDSGLSYQEATKQRTQSDQRIGEALEYTKIHNEMLRAPELYVFDSCHRLIWEMEHYRWDEYTGKSADKHSPKEKPIDKDDHAIECLGRILIQNPIFEPLKKQRDDSYKIDFDPYAR